MTHNKSDIQSLLNKYPLLIDKAIQIIGDNQTADELGSKYTKHNNGVGFTASYGTIGTVLYQFVTGRDCKKQGHPIRWKPKSLVTDADVLDRTRDMLMFKNRNPHYAKSTPREIAKMIVVLHWRQLGGLMDRSTWVTPPVIVTTQQPQTITVRYTRVVRETSKAILLEKVDAQGVAWERWLPKSMIVNNLEAGYLEIKKTA
jgi:hypothetical protein|tara:strand:- start:457 stop:1059 length:603 start_codon:yes stop_codon:yes gene_type:complete